MTDEYRFVVRGLPQPKGSARAFVNKRTGRAIVTSTNRNLKSWEQTVRFVLQDFEGLPWEGPVGVRLVFNMPRPKSAPKRILWPTTRPDIDKLARACLDAMSLIVFRDDAQVVDLQVFKRFAGERRDGSGEFVGVEGVVWRQV